MKYNGTKVSVKYSRYMNNNRLALALFDEEQSPYATLTVNVPEEELSNEHCAFIDTNNLPEAPEFLDKYELGKFTGRWACSGFCMYPEYEFHKEDILKGYKV